MPQTSPVMGLPYLEPAQAQKHVTHNEALRILDAVTQLAVQSAGQTEPPAEPADGDRHIVGSPATGAWAGQDHAVAVHADAGWQFFAPQPGWRADLAPTGTVLRFDGTGWVTETIEDLPLLGVNTTADTVNRLAVASEAVLLTHAGAGHQLKINKNAETDTASLLFQTGWSGRAEMGTTGSDDFAIKVSADGANWTNALSVAADSGSVRVSRLVMEGAIGINNYFGRADGWEDGLPSGLGAPDFLMAGGVHNSFAFASLANSGTEGLLFGRLIAGTNSFDEQMRLDVINKRLGIGTSAPTADLHVDGPVRLGSATVATLPSAAATGAGGLIFVSDETGGPVLAFSDGSAWRRCTDRAVVS